MPTGYTSKLMESGQSFQEFVFGCARAMGALVMMRDDPMDAPIPEEFKPSPYYLERINQAKTRLGTLRMMNDKEKFEEGQRLRNKKLESVNEWAKKESAENERIDRMEQEVLRWSPPSQDHVEFKNFMLDQLRISRNNTEYIQRRIAEVESKSPLVFFADAISEALRSIEYGEKELEKELERTNGRNEWIRQLRESVPK